MALKARFTFFFVLFVAGLNFIFSFLVYQQVQSHLISQGAKNLNRFLEHEIQHWEKDDVGHWTSQTKNLYLTVKKDGDVIFDSRPKKLPSEFNTRSIIKELEKDGYSFTAFYDTEELHSYLDTLKMLFLVTGIVMLLITAPLAYIAAWLLLLPFRVLAEATREFSAYNLSHRLVTPKHLDEYGLLVRSFNNLFERLQSSFNELQRYAQNVSHEFRTPLSVIAAQAESALRKEADSIHRQNALNKILRKARHLDGMASHLLALGDIRRWAQNDRNTVPIDVLNVSKEVALSIQKKPWAAEKTFSTFIEPSVSSTTHISEEIFTTVVGNLLENAFYFAKSRVNINIDNIDGYLELSIHDDGPGITIETLTQVFEPFFTQREGGHGLGLTIVKAAVEATKGKIKLSKSSNLGGLGAYVFFPLSKK